MNPFKGHLVFGPQSSKSPLLPVGIHPPRPQMKSEEDLVKSYPELLLATINPFRVGLATQSLDPHLVDLLPEGVQLLLADFHVSARTGY